ncbi:TraB/GumN family protein [Rubripirellula obstinata]|nr:TraB/GumN family protein [Rubripirellula obstinata]
MALLFLLFTGIANRLLAQTDVATPPAASEKVADAKPEADVSDSALYMRIKKTDQDKPEALQTAIVRYEGQPGTKHDGAIVDLVGVVHIGQGEYYKDLNERLSKYDSVLYELVAPDGTRIRPEDLKKRRSMLASMQTGMKDMLNLEYQLELVDYMAENFRHADMSPDEFVEDLKRRGDSVVKMVARMMGAGLASQAAGAGDGGMLLAFFSENRSKMMKQTMAKQLIDIDLVTAGMNDANGDNTIIKGRNVKAFSVLSEELAAGKEEVAVFYGAGHLPDMAERLEADFGMKATGTTWLTAWDLTRN